MEQDHVRRDAWRRSVGEHVPGLEAAAIANFTPEQREESKIIADVRKQIKEHLGDKKAVMPSLEQRAKAVGLTPWYDLLYRYESNAGMHPSMFATDLLLESTPHGLRLNGEPTRQLVPVPVYLRGAHLLHEALKDCGEQLAALRLPELDELWMKLAGEIIMYGSKMIPGWQTPPTGSG